MKIQSLSPHPHASGRFPGILWALVGLTTHHLQTSDGACAFQELHATVNSEAKNMSSATFLKTTWHDNIVGHLDYFRSVVWRHFMVLLCNFFNVWNLVTIHFNCLEMTSTPFSCQTPVVFCGLYLTFSLHEVEKMMTEFSCWVNYPFKNYMYIYINS